MAYDGIIFDMDGVLLDSAEDGFQWALEVRKEKAREMGYTYSGTAGGFVFDADSYEEMKELIENSQFSWNEALEIEKSAAQRKIEMVRNGEIEFFEQVETVLKVLDVPMAVVSNAYGDALDEIIREKGFDRYLDFWTAPRLSEIEKYHSIWKPETHMLDRAIGKMGCENAVMVGDDWFDLKAAENACIDSVLIDRDHNSVEIKPDHRISSLKQLEKLVESSQH